MTKLGRIGRIWLVRLLSPALMGLSAACASATATGEQSSTPSRGAVISYPVAVDEIGRGKLRFFAVAEGIHPPVARTAGCPSDLCDLLTGWASPGTGWSVGRLSTGEYVYLATDEKKSWAWRRGNDIDAVTKGRFDEWPDAGEAPGQVPPIRGYAFKAAKPVPALRDVFLGLWESLGTANPRYLLGLFKDQPAAALGFGDGVGDLCVIATSNAPVVAFDASHPLHGVHWGFTAILRRKGADQIQIVSFGMFPHSLKCMNAPM